MSRLCSRKVLMDVAPAMWSGPAADRRRTKIYGGFGVGHIQIHDQADPHRRTRWLRRKWLTAGYDDPEYGPAITLPAVLRDPTSPYRMRMDSYCFS